MFRRFLEISVLVLLSALTAVCLAQTGGAGNSADDPIAGVWRGSSNCMVKDSPCHDETNVYRIARVAGKAVLVTVTGSKIVNGNEVVMGTSSDWKYDPVKHSLDSADGRIHLTIDGNKMEGELTLPDKTVYRRIHLTWER